ncbi:hypothetical protein [Actinoplanes sp. NBRC 103695]|uniref:hypothetical protein n=1 Tax=Actinoplanes sp. NBRC 103695 TaxID=3032202 RepID=UPI0024A04A7E|nr:hypothetical protein [Actinoplanes sp. NBRC 103695]GLY97455.1 hypothetical protein Acsp02_47090 [Actinoplanes sp. NBRC 103695]
MTATPIHTGRGTSRAARLVLALLLGAGLAGGIAVAAASPAAAEPVPAPAPAPGAPPSPGPNPTPSPIGPPPTGNPSPNPSPTPAPAPSPGASPTPPPATSSDDDPAWYDIPGQIREAITDFFAWMVKTGLNPVMETLGKTVLSTPDLTNNPQVKAIWTTSLVIANAVFVLFVVIGGFVVTSRESLQTRHGLKEILPRLVIGGVGANLSLLVCAQILKAVNALTAAIAGQGVDAGTAATAITQAIEGAAQGNSFMVTLMRLAALVMAIIVVLTFILRVAATILLIGVSPLALMCHATPQTEGLAYTWWRAFGACLGMQLAQAFIMLATVRVFLTPTGPAVLGIPVTTDGFLAILVCLTMLWVQIKLPGWMKMFILGPLGQSKGRGLLGQIVSTILTIKTLGAAAGILGGARAAGAAAGTAARRGPGTAPRPGPGRPGPGRPGPGRPGPGRPPRPGPTRPPRPPRAGPSRPSPAPAGPAAFSHAPATHTPLAQPAGTTAAPAFSHAEPPATASAAPAGAAPPAVFSAAPSAHPAPSASAPPSAMPFSRPPTTPATSSTTTGSAPVSTSAPAVVFSAAPHGQTAPRRPPAPVTPTFSSAPATPPRPRPTAAKRAPATPARTPRPTGAVPAAPPRPPGRSG